MKTFIRIIALLSVLAAVSCQQFKIDTQMTPEKAAASIKLVCDALDSYNAPATNPDNITFNVSSNTPWTIVRSSGADWVTVTPSSSATSALISDVVVTLANNTGSNDRSATLTVKGDNIVNSKVITIKQARMGKLFVTPMASDYSVKGGPLGFTIQTNVDWEVRSNVSWLTFSHDSGAPDPDGKAITIIATAEPSQVLERTATITVVAGDDEETFDVSQKGIFELTEVTRTFNASGDSDFILLRTDLPWTVMSDKSWIEFLDHEGTGDGSLDQIEFTVLPNEGAARSANITVKAGGVEKTFEVSQNGFTFEIVEPASNELPRQGGEIILSVNSGLAWEPATSVSGWTVEKIDASSFKVKAAFNDIFIAKTGKVSISGTGGAYAEVELTQDINFTFKGHYEIQKDGSVKVYEDEVSGIFTKDKYRYVIMDADVELHLGDKGSFTMCTEHYSDGGYEYELQLNLQRSDAFRLRANGGKVTTSGAKEFTFSKDKANAMKHAQIQFVPDTETVGMINESFYCDGEKQDNVMIATSAFAGDPDLAGDYSIASIKAADDGSYFIIKSCTVTPVTE